MENEKKAPNKWLIAGAAILGVLLLGNLINGDDASAPTETVTVEASPSKSPTQESNSGASSSSASVEDEFIMYMTVVDTPSWMLEGEALDILVNQAKTVCGYIGDGDSKEDILWIITLAAEQSDSSQEIIDAFLAAAVAGTYTYCPQYEGFWD
jgi:hypothetical protein